jgi:linoleoyl-CoA desaturase
MVEDLKHHNSSGDAIDRIPEQPVDEREGRPPRGKGILRDARHRVSLSRSGDAAVRGPVPVRFTQDASLATAREAMQEMKARVADYFASRQISSKANAAMVVKGLCLVALAVVPYGLILSNRFNAWGMLGLAVIMGVGIAGIGFGIAHDALHGAYTSHARLNDVLGLSFDALGASSYMWKITHNIVHHTYTNIHGVDEDLAVSPLLRLSPNAERLWFHRLQHFYAFPLYACTTLFWVFVKDYQQLLGRDLGPYRDKQHDRREVVMLCAAKCAYYSYALAVPLVIVHLPWWQVLLGFLAMHLTAGLILGLVFQLAHIVEDTAHPIPDDDGRMATDWWLHEMHTTANFGQRNRLLSWYVGGLNHQIEHHLFPKVCSIHYPAISDIVRDVAQSHGLPYHAQPTFRAALASHYRMLRRLGSTKGQ